MKNQEEKRKHKRKKWYIAIIILIILIIIIVLGAKIYLFFNLIIGNDVLIRLNTDNENLFLFHNQSQTIKIQTNILTNPFCSVKCNYSFSDLSYNKTSEKDSFELKTTSPISKEYALYSPGKSSGQDIYRFDIECIGIRTFLCHTTDDIKTRSILITLNYDLNESEKKIKQDSKENLILLNNNMQSIEDYVESIDSQINNINLSEFIDFKKNISSIKIDLLNSNQSIQEISLLWENEDYSSSFDELKALNKTIYAISGHFDELNNSLSDLVNEYNNQIDNLSIIQDSLKDFQKINVSNEIKSEINNAILLFNNLTSNFQETDMNSKEALINNLDDRILSINQLISKNNESVSISNAYINPFNQSKIEIKPPVYNTNTDLALKEPSSKCCIFNECGSCCDDSCTNNKSEYPIVFVHGHDFNMNVSAEYNLNSFGKIQRKLEPGYTDAGSMLLGSYNESLKGIWGKIRNPISIKVSYYFDIIRNKEGNIILQTKKDNLDTYAVRLNEIINLVKYKTNRGKVILITHSMGGLVARRYIQVFGEDSVDKLILITSPNNGISSNTLRICPIFGSRLECEDMDKNSLFMNKLKNSAKPTIPVYNIIGIGCDTNQETGDGVVENSSAFLDYATNYYVNGTCIAFQAKYLHTEILDPVKYPEVVDIIKNLTVASL